MKKFFFTAAIAGLSAGAALSQTLEEGIKAWETDKPSAASAILRKLANSNPEAGYFLTSFYLDNDKLDSAKIIADAANATPNPMGYAALGKYQLAIKDLANAKISLDKAISLSKEKDVKVFNVVADAYITTDNKDPKKAIELLNKSIALDKKNQKTYILLGEAYVEIADGGNAVTNLEQAELINNQNPKPYFKVGQIYSRSKNYDLAAQNLNKAIELDPNYAPAYRELGELNGKQKKFDEASKYFAKYLEVAEKNPAVMSKYAKALFQANDYEKCINACNEVLKTDPSNTVMYRLIGYCFVKQIEESKDKAVKEQKAKDGFAALNKYLEVNATKPEKILASDFENIGKLYFNQSNDSLAVLNYQKAAAMDENNADLYAALGEAYSHWKKWDKAAEAYQNKVSKSKTNSALDYFNLGKAHYYNKNLTLADTAFAMVIKIKPNLSTGYFWRAKSNYTEKTPEAPKPYFEKYLEVVLTEKTQPKKDMIEAYNYLGTYFVQKEDNVKAKEYFQKILELDPENKNAKEAISRLK